MSIKKFISAESFDEVDLKDEDDVLMEEAALEMQRLVLESFAQDFRDSATYDAGRHLGLEDWLDADQVSENTLSHKGDFLQQGRDWLHENITDLSSKLVNPIANFFTGVNRTLEKTDKLISKVHDYNDEFKRGQKFEKKGGFNKLKVKGTLPKDIRELTKEVKELNAYGEWLINDYRKHIDDLGMTFADMMRDGKKARIGNKEDVVKFFVQYFRDKKFPIPPGAKVKDRHDELYIEYSTPGILGDAQMKAFILNNNVVNSLVDAPEYINLIAGQWVKVTKSPDQYTGNDRIEIPYGRKDELLELLKESEKLVTLAKRMSNEVKNIHTTKILGKLMNGFEDFVDLILNVGAPITMIRYFITAVRRSLFTFVRAYTRWTYHSYSSYIKNAYDVGKAVNKLVEQMLK